MSGFVCHVRCPVCGSAGPSIDLGSHSWEPDIVLPASNLVTQELDAVVIVRTRETEVLSNAELARFRSTPDHPVAAVVIRGNTLALEPPLPCPRGHGNIEAAIWGDGRPCARP